MLSKSENQEENVCEQKQGRGWKRWVEREGHGSVRWCVQWVREVGVDPQQQQSLCEAAKRNGGARETGVRPADFHLQQSL